MDGTAEEDMPCHFTHAFHGFQRSAKGRLMPDIPIPANLVTQALLAAFFPNGATVAGAAQVFLA